MAAIRHLRRAPITEAVVDLRAVPKKGFDAELLKRIAHRVHNAYPLSQERHAASAQFAFEPGQVPKTMSRELGFHGVWVRSQDEKEVAQFRVDGFAFSRLKPYTSWDDILPKALDLWNNYVELVAPEAVTRVASRYINHLPLQDGTDLDDYVVTGPKLPENVPDELGRFSSRVMLIHSEKRLKANVTQSLEVAVRSNTPTLLLDIDAFKTGNFETTSGALTPVLNDLRDYKNQIFFGSLTEDFVRTFE